MRSDSNYNFLFFSYCSKCEKAVLFCPSHQICLQTANANCGLSKGIFNLSTGTSPDTSNNERKIFLAIACLPSRRQSAANFIQCVRNSFCEKTIEL